MSAAVYHSSEPHQSAPCTVTSHVHVMWRVLRFGHPVSALDLVVEARIHDHPGVRGATFRWEQILMSLST